MISIVMMIVQLKGVLMVSIFFGLLYTLCEKAIPGSFGFSSVIDPFYFSFTTMSTAGYGDFSPKNDFAKVIVMIQQFVIMGEILSILGVSPGKEMKKYSWIQRMMK